jgi:hypothetical protein
MRNGRGLAKILWYSILKKSRKWLMGVTIQMILMKVSMFCHCCVRGFVD